MVETGIMVTICGIIQCIESSVCNSIETAQNIKVTSTKSFYFMSFLSGLSLIYYYEFVVHFKKSP